MPTNFYIPGHLRQLRSTDVYDSIIEAVTNSIQAIEEKGEVDGVIDIEIKRANKLLDDNENKEVLDLIIHDNGIGFNTENVGSFNFMYSNKKLEVGGKGAGRFLFLKHFTDVKLSSHYETSRGLEKINFTFGRVSEIMEEVEISEADKQNSGTSLFLYGVNYPSLNTTLEVMARKILSRLLLYFVSDDFLCPKITLIDGEKRLVLNELIKDEDFYSIDQLESHEFEIEKANVKQKFTIHLFRVWFTNKQKKHYTASSSQFRS